MAANETAVGAAAAKVAQVIARANELPSPTWNKLSINSIDLAVPEVAGPAPEELPARAAGGMGEGAAGWIARAAGGVARAELPGADGSHDLVLDLGELPEGPAAAQALDIAVAPGADARVVLVARPSEGRKPDLSSDAAAREGGAPVGAWSVRVEAGADSRVELLTFVASGGNRCLADVGVSCAEGARVAVRQFFLEAPLSAAGVLCDLAGDRSQADIDARYLGRGDDVLDFNYVVRQRGRGTKCQMRFSGVLAESAHKALRDTIDLVHGCKGSAGQEDETVVLVGDGVENKSLPVVLCDEDDVAGTHGATIGEVDPAQLAYMASRGLASEDVPGLLMESTFSAARAAAQAAGCDVAAQAVEASARRVLGEAFA